MRNLDLLLCPFCGSKAELKSDHRDLGGSLYWIACKECGCKQAPSIHKESVIKAWNTRKHLDYKVPVLPVNLSDTVWTLQSMSGCRFRKKDKPYNAKVVFIGLNDSEEYGGGIFNVDFGNGHMLQFRFSDLGKLVFLSKDEINFI